MTHIFISGGGDFETSKKFDISYINLLNGGKNILYIPRAFYPNRYSSCKERIDNVFPKNKGYNVTIISENKKIIIDELINEYDGIYIGGGNTYRLQYLLIKTGFNLAIKEFEKMNKPIYGGSAGAIILGKDVHTSSDINAMKINFNQSLGLNYFNDYSIFYHYQQSDDDIIIDYINSYNFPVIALPEGTGLYKCNNTYTVEGNASAIIIKSCGSKEIIKSGEILYL